jgi:hypothetical protein
MDLKFYDTGFEVSRQYAKEITDRSITFRKATKTRKNVFTTLISVYGAIKNEYYLTAFTNQLLIDDLFT